MKKNSIFCWPSRSTIVRSVLLLSVMAVSFACSAFAQEAVRSYYPTRIASNLGDVQYVTSYPYACWVEFYNGNSYVIKENVRYNYRSTQNGEYHYLSTSGDNKELIFSSDYSQMAWEYLTFEFMGIKSVSFVFYSYLGDGKTYAESYKQQQMAAGSYNFNNYSGSTYSNYGSGSSYGSGSTQGRVQCALCFGDGKCISCSGSGLVRNPYTSDYMNCSTCNGTGRCHHCHGSGQCTCNRSVHPTSCGQVMYRNSYIR